MGHLSHIRHLPHLPHVFGQRRRPPAGPPPAPTVTITDVVWLDNNHVRVSFSAPVVTQDVGAWAGFWVGGMQPNVLLDVDPQTVELGFSEQVNAGDAWEVAAQPDWLVTPVVVPQARGGGPIRSLQKPPRQASSIVRGDLSNRGAAVRPSPRWRLGRSPAGRAAGAAEESCECGLFPHSGHCVGAASRS